MDTLLATLRFLRLGFVFLTATLLIAGRAQAATITVDTAEDQFDLFGPDGQCSLREAIAAANSDGAADSCAAGSGDDEIVFEPALEGETIVLDIEGSGEDDGLTGDLDVDDAGGAALTITGPVAGDSASIIVDGNDTDRVFHAFTDLNLQNLTVRNGQTTAGPRDGGGIFADGPGPDLVLNHVLISENSATFSGGGLWVRSGSFELHHSTVSDNTAGDFGGGIWFAIGTLTLTNSTVSGNSAAGFDGGGLNVSNGDIALINSTVSGNSAGRDGGGLDTGTVAGTVVGLNNVTVTDNTAAGNGGGIFNDTGTVTTSNSIIAGNDADTDGPDCFGDVTSGNFNLIGNDSDCGFTAMAEDLLNVNARLGPLAGNGGPTRTHALRPDSPAVDSGDPNTPGAGGTCETEDQRGEPRPEDGDDDGAAVCDMGAFEGTVAGGGGGGGSSGGCSMASDRGPLDPLLPLLVLLSAFYLGLDISRQARKERKARKVMARRLV